VKSSISSPLPSVPECALSAEPVQAPTSLLAFRRLGGSSGQVGRGGGVPVLVDTAVSKGRPRRRRASRLRCSGVAATGRPQRVSGWLFQSATDAGRARGRRCRRVDTRGSVNRRPSPTPRHHCSLTASLRLRIRGREEPANEVPLCRGTVACDVGRRLHRSRTGLALKTFQCPIICPIRSSDFGTLAAFQDRSGQDACK